MEHEQRLWAIQQIASRLAQEYPTKAPEPEPRIELEKDAESAEEYEESTNGANDPGLLEIEEIQQPQQPVESLKTKYDSLLFQGNEYDVELTSHHNDPEPIIEVIRRSDGYILEGIALGRGHWFDASELATPEPQVIDEFAEQFAKFLARLGDLDDAEMSNDELRAFRERNCPAFLWRTK